MFVVGGGKGRMLQDSIKEQKQKKDPPPRDINDAKVRNQHYRTRTHWIKH